MKLFVGCSSRDEIPKKYYDDCKKFLSELFTAEHELVFGACGKGLMGVAYNIAVDNGSNIVGIYPECYKSEVVGLECLEIPVSTVNERTEKLIENSDVLVFLPGGIGTLYELFTAIECKRAGEHNKPIFIYNSFGFYDELFEQLNKMKMEKFTSLSDDDCYCVCSSAKQVIGYLNDYNKQ